MDPYHLADRFWLGICCRPSHYRFNFLHHHNRDPFWTAAFQVGSVGSHPLWSPNSAKTVRQQEM